MSTPTWSAVADQTPEIERKPTDVRGTVDVSLVYANGPTGDLRITVTDPASGDSLTGYISAEDVRAFAIRALGGDQ